MAQSLENNRAKIRTTIHGRRLGIDGDEMLAGVKGTRTVVTAGTSVTADAGTLLANHGVNTVTAVANSTWDLTDPIAGVSVRLVTGTSSTLIHAIEPVAATILSTNGVAGSSIIMTGPGAHIELMGISTSQWSVISRGGSTLATAATQVNVSS